MPVDIGCCAGLGMPGAALDRVERGAHIEQEGDRGVPQVVETDVREAGCPEQLLELVTHSAVVHRRANRAWEDQVIFLPVIPRNCLLSSLPFLMLHQFLEHPTADLDLPMTGAGLGRHQDISLVLDKLQLPLYE